MATTPLAFMSGSPPAACAPTPASIPFVAVRLSLHLLVYLLALSTSPGLVELVDDAAHLLLAGHTEHGDDAEGECSEHGCTPASHHCGCCTSIAMAAPTDRAIVRRAERMSQTWVAEVLAAGPNGVRDPLDRPPTA